MVGVPATSICLNEHLTRRFGSRVTTAYLFCIKFVADIDPARSRAGPAHSFPSDADARQPELRRQEIRYCTPSTRHPSVSGLPLQPVGNSGLMRLRRSLFP